MFTVKWGNPISLSKVKPHWNNMNNTSELVKGKQFGSTKDVLPGERAGASLRFYEFYCGLCVRLWTWHILHTDQAVSPQQGHKPSTQTVPTLTQWRVHFTVVPGLNHHHHHLQINSSRDTGCSANSCEQSSSIRELFRWSKQSRWLHCFLKPILSDGTEIPASDDILMLWQC